MAALVKERSHESMLSSGLFLGHAAMVTDNTAHIIQHHSTFPYLLISRHHPTSMIHMSRSPIMKGKQSKYIRTPPDKTQCFGETQIACQGVWQPSRNHENKLLSDKGGKIQHLNLSFAAALPHPSRDLARSSGKPCLVLNA